jgi:hypothetical protein
MEQEEGRLLLHGSCLDAGERLPTSSVKLFASAYHRRQAFSSVMRLALPLPLGNRQLQRQFQSHLIVTQNP